MAATPKPKREMAKKMASTLRKKGHENKAVEKARMKNEVGLAKKRGVSKGSQNFLKSTYK